MEVSETRKRPHASIAHDVHCNEPRNTNKRRKKQPAPFNKPQLEPLPPSPRTPTPQRARLTHCDGDGNPHCLPALTESNLRQHTQQTDAAQPAAQPADQPAMAAVSTRSSGNTSVFDTHEQLKQYGVRIDSTAPYPPELRAFIDDVINRPRPAPHSPAAKNLHNNAAYAQMVNEWRAMEKLAPDLMFVDAVDDRGEELVALTPEARFDTAYVTHPTKPRFVLSQPRPDKTNGYIPSDLAEKCRTKAVRAPFTKEEEQKLLLDLDNPPIERSVLCPWYTIEFKALENYAGCKIAKLQTCRNGVAVCEYMARLYQRAGIVPDAVDTCHWSLTCDTKTIELFVHWRVQEGDEVQYHMRRISTAALEGDEDEVENDKVVKIRKRLRNLLEHARGQRLDRIKFALSGIALPTPRSSSPRKRAAASQLSGSLRDEAIGASITSSALVPPPGFARPAPATDRTQAQPQAARRRDHTQQEPIPAPQDQPRELRRNPPRTRRKPDTA